MLDFFMVAAKHSKNGKTEIYPKFKIRSSHDLMIRGGDFYAIWDEYNQLWSTDEEVALYLIDKELEDYAEKYKKEFPYENVSVLYMWDAETCMIDKWHRYVQKQMRDKYHPLDDKLIFANTEIKKEDYASKRLPYALEQGPIEAYDELISTLYSPEERHKIEWAIGSIVTGDSVNLQKFLVFYGSAGTGKSTVLNIIQQLFEGYYSVFDAKALGTISNSFALEPFRTNPLVAIQHDGDLSRIEDNTRINSIVSHEEMTVNEKFKATYTSRFKAFLFMGTNRPVKITDAKSGILRRLIDVEPSGKKLGVRRYNKVVSQIQFELGHIAWHCAEIYRADPHAYDTYVPVSMLGASNDFYNFVLEKYETFSKNNETTLKEAYAAYKQYCEDSKVSFPYPKRAFKEELKNYFDIFLDIDNGEEGRMYNVYKGFIEDKFVYKGTKNKEREPELKNWIEFFEDIPSVFDTVCGDCKAQYAKEDGTPKNYWTDVKTTLSDLDTRELHYVRVPEEHIVIDFDIPDEEGNKCLEKNLEAASHWPKTYAELSKSGGGIHLHYIYNGDVTKLSRIYAPHVEIKVYTGKMALRRKLTKCNKEQINTISSGLPLKEEVKVVNFDSIKSEKGLRTMILRNLQKEFHPGTKPSIDFIYKILEDAYASGLKYDVTDMRPSILYFASGSTHQSMYCIKLVNKMKFKSEDTSSNIEDYNNEKIVFYDVEVFPNLFLICWKFEGENEPIHDMINPSPRDCELLMGRKLVGFNCRKYDNHILYARMMGYTNAQLYQLSQRIISNDKKDRNCFFGEAYNVSYADIYDFSSKKQSLKKFEIELGIHHQELGLPWDKPVPEELWPTVADYCHNDVIATEATFNYRKQDFIARQILADISGLTVNDTSRMHATKIIFGDEKHPELVYTDLSEMFPGYTFEKVGTGVKSMYRGEDPGEGGYVYSEPGIYRNVALLDIASMHPSSIINLNLFGEYTKKFKDILDARLYIKHKDFESAGKLMNGALKPYLKDPQQAKDLAQAMKIIINSVYGYTTATFSNPFKDERNVDNIVAKRGALFMINLKHEVQKRGFTVVHIKTDSIKIADATPEIIEFVMNYGKQYGYNFEHEATYDRICLVNRAVYIAKYSDDEAINGGHCGEWTATGTQFQIPYVFKTLFSHEPIEFSDMCETKQVNGELYLDFNEGLGNGEHDYRYVGKVGRFCPIKPGCGGAELFREKDGKYSAAVGTKGWRWKESEIVQHTPAENDIDIRYYGKLVDEAIATISEYGDFGEFVS